MIDGLEALDYYMWWWKRGMGDALLNERISDIIKEYKNDVITWHDPFRLAPVYGRHKGLDLIGQWTYTFPDPKYSIQITSLNGQFIYGTEMEGTSQRVDLSSFREGV